MKTLLKLVGAVILLAGTFAGGYIARSVHHPAAAPAASARRILYYVDPMHPAYKSDKPGIAPDCGMQLEPVYADADAAPAASPERKILYYRDPQDPSYTAQKSGLNPDTGNTLEPVYEPPSRAVPPPGAINVSPERQQAIGVKFATVEHGGATRAIRAVGTVTADETRIGHVHTRVEGWIEKVFVDFTGAVVKAGQPMLSIYSPEMLASQQELLLAARERELMQGSALTSAAAHGESLFQAARRRLELWNLSDDQIQQVLKTGEPIRSTTVFSPMGGFVTERNVFPNQKVTPDTDLYTITDLTRVWIVADVFESDITAIKVGDPAYVSFSNGSAPPLGARVSYIQPQVDPTTRTMRVRLDAVNPGLRMKPDMFVNVDFGVAATPQLTVPAGAVVDTGERQTAFVDLGNGYLEPRRVVIGERFGDRVAITSGLSAGERVVSSGTFLIDSESQLRAAADSMGAPQHPQDGAGTGDPAQMGERSPEAPAPSPHSGHGRD
jgi:membrane fusion protein, copper/silver efflux system